jgi:hypothetical protein
VEGFLPYVEHLRGLLSGHGAAADDPALRLALDGEPGTFLRSQIPQAALRDHGAFFSGHALSTRLVDGFAESLSQSSVIADPACGAGDLLVAASQRLPVASNLPATLEAWSERLVGLDIHPSFVDAARLRLALAAVARGARLSPGSFAGESGLAGLSVGSFLERDAALERATHVILNPPFAARVAPPDCGWGSGLVNSAAIFLERVVRTAREGAKVAAVLPDVLRSGTRYARWRAVITSHLDVDKIDIVGRFADDVDVDVFLLFGTTIAQQPSMDGTVWEFRASAGRVIGDLFDVSVGPLVPHRDPVAGPWGRLVRPIDAPPWATVCTVASARRFSGRMIEGPFVTVRRTSRPGDGIRAVASVVSLRQPAVVENHLLVLQPKDGRLGSCTRLRDWLRTDKITELLDHRIRCRHLTVGSLRELPAWAVAED